MCTNGGKSPRPSVYSQSQLSGVEYLGNDVRIGGFPDRTSNIFAKR